MKNEFNSIKKISLGRKTINDSKNNNLKQASTARIRDVEIVQVIGNKRKKIMRNNDIYNQVLEEIAATIE